MLFGKKKKVNLKIEGMHCEKCVAKVAECIKKLGGKAEIDQKLGRAVVTCPAALEEGALKAAVEALGFKCNVL
ncbi:MAG: heavy-metal-associated domain-containing protein [Clostridia bacterium]|nr:heavy-metal-associated domain-containing protein [Clostridia bacterium]